MTADEVKQLLQLQPLAIEGGFFRETYRSRWNIAAEYLPDGIRGPRSIGTAIYYMVTPETFSALHQLPGSEIFSRVSGLFPAAGGGAVSWAAARTAAAKITWAPPAPWASS